MAGHDVREEDREVDQSEGEVVHRTEVVHGTVVGRRTGAEDGLRRRVRRTTAGDEGVPCPQNQTMEDDEEDRVLQVRRMEGDVGAGDLYLVPRTVGEGVTLAQLLILRLEVVVGSSLHGFPVHQ